MKSRFGGKQIAQLLLVILLGWGVGQLVNRARPIGRNVAADPVATGVMRDRSAPSAEVAGADLTLIVFTDYQCPACKLAAPAMDAAVARDGHVRVVYRDWPIFGPVSDRAARVAIAADRQGLYPAVHGLLMAERRPLDDRVLADVVGRAGGDWAQVRADLRRYAMAIGGQLRRNSDDARRLGMTGTPSYLVGPLLVEGAMDEAGFTRAFAAARDAGA